MRTYKGSRAYRPLSWHIEFWCIVFAKLYTPEKGLSDHGWGLAFEVLTLPGLGGWDA